MNIIIMCVFFEFYILSLNFDISGFGTLIYDIFSGEIGEGFIYEEEEKGCFINVTVIYSCI